MFRTLIPRFNAFAVARRFHSSNKMPRIPVDPELGMDYPSSRFLPEKWIPTIGYLMKKKKVPDIDKNFTEEDRELGLDFPSSLMNYNASTKSNLSDCLLCYSLVCPYHQQRPCFPIA